MTRPAGDAHRGLHASGRAELALGVLLLAYGAGTQARGSRRWEVPAGVAAGLGAVALARGAGTSWDDLGLQPDAVAPGLRLGAATLLPVAAAVGGAVAIPATRRLFADDRVLGSSGRELAYDALVRIPLATAGTEELLFRSALLGLALHRGSPRRAIVSSSIIFGLWHVLPALRSHDANAGTARLADRAGGKATTVLATVAVTAAAGAGFAWLRLRSRSVVAPIVAHAGINAAALVAATVAGRRR